MRYRVTLLLFMAVVLPAPGFCQAPEAANPFPELLPYAVLADAVYQNEVLIAEACKKLGYRLKVFDFVPAVELSFLVAEREKDHTLLVAVRGTATVANALVDARFPLVQDKHTGIRLHEGFAQATGALYPKLLPWLDKGVPVETTGHSLGGAVALILGMYLRTDQYNIKRIVTFGQPKVTNAPGANGYSDLNITRVVTAGDLVPLLPPIDPMDFNNMDVFWHVGQELILLKGQDYAIAKGSDSMMRAATLVTQQLTERAVDQHMMFYYLQQIESRRTNARLVPYEGGKDLLKLFGTK